MIAAVGLSLLIGVPLGIVAGRSDRFQRAITPVLDAMQIVPAFAYLMPVVLLFSIGPAAAVVSTMIYAIPPAVRITALGIRGVATNTVEAAASMGATRRQMLEQGAASARAADAAARRQPDDPLRALDGRDRRPDRRRRARRRRQQRPLLEPGARAPRRHRDRDHGDGARPRRPRRSPSAPTRPSATSTTAQRSRCARSPIGSWSASSARRGRRREAARRRRGLPATRPASSEQTVTLQPWILRADPVGARLRPEPRHRGSSRSPSRSATPSSRSCLLPIQSFLVESPWFVTLAGLDADRVRRLAGCGRRSRRS